MKNTPILLALLLLAATATPQAKPTHPGHAIDTSRDWKAKAQKCGLSSPSIAQLERDGILVTDEAYKQVFSAYLDRGKNPVFITSDSLLNAYHILYEESIFQLEVANAKRMEPFLRSVLEALEKKDGIYIKCDPELMKTAVQRAELVLGIALRLLDDEFHFDDATLDAILKDEVARIEKAEGLHMPEWLGKPTASFMGLDYNRYKPRGFYAKRNNLSRYFRALSWLHSIPFRINSDEELLSFLIITLSGWDLEVEGPANYSQFLGHPDNIDITDTISSSWPFRTEIPGDDFEKFKNQLLEKAKSKGRINDLEPSCRVLSAYQTPSALLFTQTTAPRIPGRPLPNGLEIAAALGSDFATNLLDPALAPIINDQKHDFRQYPYPVSGPRPNGLSLYPSYLHVLEALINPPEPDAPEFMTRDAWKIKSLNTLLGSWSLMRHTWALQAKQSVLWMCASSDPVGFVEPEPDFFSRMSNLALATKTMLLKENAFKADYIGMADSINLFIGQYGTLKNRDAFEDHFRNLPSSEQANYLNAYVLLDCSPSNTKYGTDAHYRETVEWMKNEAKNILEGNIDKQSIVVRFAEQQNDLESKWGNLERISSRLESIAHKQLRKVPLSNIDQDFIADYGKTLADLCFYEGNSYFNPRDDAPKLIDVYSSINAGKYLHVGIARPRKMYVLYPWQGAAVLCEGAVLPYYEFAHSTRMDDTEWKTLLDSSKRPSVPEWVQPIVEGGNLDAPEFKR
jgi:hypothetical protein